MYVFLTCALDVVELPISRFGRYIPSMEFTVQRRLNWSQRQSVHYKEKKNPARARDRTSVYEVLYALII
jgi:hypothetical protein